MNTRLLKYQHFLLFSVCGFQTPNLLTVGGILSGVQAFRQVLYAYHKETGDNLFLSTGDPYRNDPAYKEVSEAILFFYDNDDDFY